MDNEEYLASIRTALGPVAEELVFTGGRVVQEYFVVPALDGPRVTLDADAICQARTYVEYEALGTRLRARGFTQTADRAAPPYRWRKDELLLDVVPADGDVLGFTNQWYREGLSSAEDVTLARGLRIRILSAPYFVASKLEAFQGRGEGDAQSSHDIEDIVAVLATRPTLTEEMENAVGPVGRWVALQLEEVLPQARRRELVSGHLPPTAPADLVDVVVRRIGRITAIATST